MLRLFFITFVAAATASVIHDGACPELKPVENFNLTAYQGVWYEISKIPTEFEKSGSCGRTEYKLEGDVVKVKNSHVINGVQHYIDGTAKLADDANKAAKLIITFKFGDAATSSPLKVLKTDYVHYAIAYNCKEDEKNKKHSVTAWILSRTTKLEGDAKVAVDEFLKVNAKELDSSKFVQTDFSENACKFTSTSVISERPQPVKS